MDFNALAEGCKTVGELVAKISGYSETPENGFLIREEDLYPSAADILAQLNKGDKS